jgi:lysophospholipase L1-like esterase
LVRLFHRDSQPLLPVDTESLDYFGLSHYRAANKVLPEPMPDEQRVVFFGDSITELWDLARFFPGKAYINRGIQGQTTAQMLVRFRRDVLALHPRAVVILGGANDLGFRTMGQQVITDDLTSMAELGRTNGVAVILGSVPPVNDKGGRTRSISHPPDVTREINKWMKAYAARNCYEFADYFSRMALLDGSLNPTLSDDGLHSNSAGYEVMADVLEPAITRALSRGRNCSYTASETETIVPFASSFRVRHRSE